MCQRVRLTYIAHMQQKIKSTFRTEADRPRFTQRATRVCVWPPHKEERVKQFLKEFPD